jgi:hypothetical protein
MHGHEKDFLRAGEGPKKNSKKKREKVIMLYGFKESSPNVLIHRERFISIGEPTKP